MTGNEIRSAFIQFFESEGHKHVRSSSLVPHNDPTILFTNAGMNQFKDYFLGNEVPEFTRAVTSQKVVRAGGKHNDLENVGRTDRHHTFFEMLGNFSFGDYFKEDAITYAWKFLTEVLQVPLDKLVISVYNDDQESYDIWHQKMGVPADRIARLGEKENFWSMGDTGPCGPCSEIHFEMNPVEGKTTQQSLEEDDDRYLEIWNLVFMQFNRDSSGKLDPLPKPSIDTGMGLERIAAVMQNVQSNYDCDLFLPLAKTIGNKVKHQYGSNEETDVSCRVIADHLRASTFLIADGVLPSNEGRGYVLRRIIRRAARHGKQLGYQTRFFSDLVDDFAPMMSGNYPEIEESRDYAKIILGQEETRFSATLSQGVRILDELIENAQNEKVHGAEIFKLYDTFGFPNDLAQDILEDHNLSYDHSEFSTAMEEQRKRAQEAQNTNKIDLKVSQVYLDLVKEFSANQFTGYKEFQTETKILSILKDGVVATEIKKGDQVEVMLEKTPFYAESGGQVGDTGEITHQDFRIRVTGTNSPVAGLNLSKGEIVDVVTETVAVKLSQVTATLDSENRHATEYNHTTTHLLQAALRTVLGDHVKQAGSLVNPEKLRFDFSHYAPLTKEQIRDIETLVNKNIRLNQVVTSEEMDFDEAIKTGAMAIFGEKYGDSVRVITAGDSSKEFCGGCHTSNTGNIGLCVVTAETAIQSGVRRLEAVTGSAAVEYMQVNLDRVDRIAKLLKTSPVEIDERVERLEIQAKEKDKKIEELQKEIQQFAA
ncbi:MAG: alanyl-tRNA synthetase, partial [bacterium]